MPNTAWTLRTLIYYDSVGSIVPQQFFEHPEQNYDRFMLELVRNQLVIPINPMATLDRPFDIASPILEFLKGPNFNLERARKKFKKGMKLVPHSRVIHSQAMHSKSTKYYLPKAVATIHGSKFDDHVLYHLVEMGVAKSSVNEYYYVEPNVASHLMTLLATVIGAKKEMQPMTDTINSLKSPSAFTMESEGNEKRQQILKELIPFPEFVELEQLRKFKDKHYDTLKAFKNKIEQLAVDPSLAIDSKLFKLKVEELSFHRDELSVRMKENKFGDIFFGSICGITGGVIAMVTAPPPFSIIGGVGATASFANAIHSALKIETPEKITDTTGMKYLALLNRRISKKQSLFSFLKKRDEY